MEKTVAEEMIQLVLTLGGPFNKATLLTDRISDEKERAAYKRRLGEIMADINIKLLLPIIKEHPDLDPDK